MKQQKIPSRISDGLFKAYDFAASTNRGKITLEYNRLNTREARCAFADHLIGVWAKDFEFTWPTVYELLKLIEQDELYRDPHRVGPDAPGDKDSHGKQMSYDSFAQYFTDRLGQPLNRWAQLESTYRYVQKYAPEFFKKSFNAAAEHYRQLDAEDQANPSRQGQRADLFDANFVDNKKDNVNEVERPTGNSTEAALRRLRKDRPDIHQRVLKGEPTANAGMIEAGFRKKRASRKTTIVQRLLKLWAKATTDERTAFRAKIDVVVEAESI